MAESTISNSKDLLWENPNPTSAFSNGSLTIPDMSNYQKLLISYRASASEDVRHYAIIEKTGTWNLTLVRLVLNLNISYRTVTYTDSTHLTFGQGGYWIYNEGANWSNTWCIPLQIYGIK